MSADVLAGIYHRNEFYRTGYRTLLKVVLAQGIIIITLVALAIAAWTWQQPKDRFFATTTDGRLIQLHPVGEKHMESTAVADWVETKAEEIFTFGHHDYKQRINGAHTFFTPGGFKEFLDALRESRIVEAMENGEQVVWTRAGRARVDAEGIASTGQYAWRIVLPARVTFETPTRTSPQRWNLTATVVRVSNLKSTDGLAISQWVFSE